MIISARCPQPVDLPVCHPGTSKKQVESALKGMRGKDTKIDSQTGDEQFEALQKYGQDLTAQAAHLDPV